MYWIDNDTGVSSTPLPPAVISLTKKFFTNGGLGEPPSIPEDFWFNMVQEELLGVLTMAGIAPVKSDLGQLAKSIQSIAFSAYPVGAPIPWPLATPPDGYIIMMGQSFSPALTRLASVYPSLILPDPRGRVIRGWDNGKNLDPSRALLSLQAGQNEAHTHDVLLGSGSGAQSVLTNDAGRQPAATSNYVNAGNGGPYIRSSGGTEARMVNIAFNYIVRAI
jgi:hypothetical protein